MQRQPSDPLSSVLEFSARRLEGGQAEAELLAAAALEDRGPTLRDVVRDFDASRPRARVKQSARASAPEQQQQRQRRLLPAAAPAPVAFATPPPPPQRRQPLPRLPPLPPRTPATAPLQLQQQQQRIQRIPLPRPRLAPSPSPPVVPPPSHFLGVARKMLEATGLGFGAARCGGAVGAEVEAAVASFERAEEGDGEEARRDDGAPPATPPLPSSDSRLPPLSPAEIARAAVYLTFVPSASDVAAAAAAAWPSTTTATANATANAEAAAAAAASVDLETWRAAMRYAEAQEAGDESLAFQAFEELKRARR